VRNISLLLKNRHFCDKYHTFGLVLAALAGIGEIKAMMEQGQVTATISPPDLRG